MRRKSLWISLFCILAIIAATGIYILVQPKLTGLFQDGADSGSHSASAAQTSSTGPTSSATPSPTVETEPPQPKFADAVWMAVGDIMSHSPELPAAYDPESKSYHFDPFFEDIAPLFEDADWQMANMETPIAGQSFGYSGYPTFNAPIELAEAVKRAGFNILSTANNHTMDKGAQGALNTLDNLRGLGFLTVGTHQSAEDRDKLVLSEKNGIKMGLLAYTYGTNGIPIGEDKPYLVDLIDEEKIKSDIERLKEAGADLVTVSLHFGIEYQTMPSDEQKRLARSLVAAGADIIAGSHPHVIQPYEVVDTVDEKGEPKKALIIYSMGNFLSNQRGNSKDYGVIFKVRIRKNLTEGLTELADIEAIPTWVHRYKPDKNYRYRILPVEKTLAEQSDPLLGQADYAALEQNYTMLEDRLQALMKQ
ncbi:CapA family protein [Paenibacillus sp. HB172176]|uniref:CapA family protein n=1 Tax=Paenibacillus sp. HB172176 TaxID=2493690 RepID=UPI0014387E14|nr:CapA family protein [Paenibacillus sp. HB172176]